MTVNYQYRSRQRARRWLAQQLYAWHMVGEVSEWLPEASKDGNAIDREYISLIMPDVLEKIDRIDQRSPDTKDKETKNEILELIFQQKRFDYNKDLLSKIKNKNFSDIDFSKMHKENFETITLNSVKDAKKFDTNSIKLLYSLPEKSFALIYESNNIYLAKIKKFINVQFDYDNYKNIANEQKTNTKQRLLKSYDELLNDKYKVTLNKKTIQRVKNYFQ